MMRLPVLDERLSAAAHMMPACAYGADIGADHGRLSCYLLANNICERMCVADISAPSLQKAKRLLALHSLDNRADFRVGDGLGVLEKPAQAIAVLGMGGWTVAKILEKGSNKLFGAALILSAHTDLPVLRETLMNLQYRITQEQIVFCVGRFYTVMKALPGKEALDEKQLLLGPRLMEHPGDPVYRDFLRRKLAAASCRRDADGPNVTRIIKEEYERACDSGNG